MWVDSKSINSVNNWIQNEKRRNWRNDKTTYTHSIRTSDTVHKRIFLFHAQRNRNNHSVCRTCNGVGLCVVGGARAFTVGMNNWLMRNGPEKSPKQKYVPCKMGHSFIAIKFIHRCRCCFVAFCFFYRSFLLFTLRFLCSVLDVAWFVVHLAPHIGWRATKSESESKRGGGTEREREGRERRRAKHAGRFLRIFVLRHNWRINTILATCVH